MTLILYRDGLTGEVRRSEVLPGNRRRRLSAVVARRLDSTRAQITSRHRIPETNLGVTDETIVKGSERRHVLVGPKDIVVITSLTMGGGGGRGGGGSGKQIGMAVASIALMIAAPYAISFLGPAFAATAGVTSSLTLLGRVLSTGLIIGGVALMSMANKAKANKSNEDTRPVYGVTGGGNLPRSGDRIPRGYGRFWTAPDLSQPDYFIYSGEDQVLYKRMTLGVGRYHIHSVRVGDQLLWTEGGGYHAPFTGAEVEFIQPGAVSNLVPLDVTSSSAVSGLSLPQVGDALPWSGPFAVSPPGVNVNYIQFDVSLPSGSYGTASNSKGTYDVPTETGYEFQIAPIDFAGNVIGDWQTVVAAERYITSKRPLRYTERVNVALGRYVARGRNTKARFNSSADTRMNAVQWDGLRGWRPDVRTRPGVTEIALMVRSNESLGITTFQDVMVEATAIIPVWNGVAWVEQATRKAVWAFADVMRNGVYGGNILDSALDLATLSYYASAAAPFDTFDGVIRGPDSIWGVASTILATMRSEPVQLGRVWSMVRDEPKSIRRHVITRRQIVQGSTSIEFDTDPDDGAGHVVVEYDEGADPKRPVQPPDIVYGATSLTPQRRKLFGISSFAHAVHIGRWIGASGFYRRQTNKFSVEHEGRIYKRGDSISVEAWFASKAKVAGIVGRDGTKLTVDADIALTAGDQIILRDRTGRQWGPVALTGQGDTLRELIISAVTSGGIPIADALATDEMEPTTVIVGQPTVLTRNYLVKSARPSGRDRIAVEAQIDSTAVWDAIGEEIGSPPSPEAGPQTPVVPQLFYVNGEMAQGVAEPMVKWSVSPARGATGYQVEVSYDDGESWSAIYAGPDTAGVAPLAAALFNDDGGAPIILIRARAVGRTGLWSPYINNSFGAFAAGVHAGRLIDGTLDAIKFAQGIEPVGLASGLPNPAGYAGPQVILNILDNKLYRLTSEGWISTVAAEDIDGVIQAAQLAAIEASKITGQLTDAQIEAVAAAKVSGQLTNDQIADIAATKVTGQIVDQQIQSMAAIKIGGQLSDSQIAAIAAAKVTGQLTSDQIASLAAAKVAGQLTNAQIADIAAAKVTGQLTSDQIASLAAAKVAGQLSNDQLAAIAAAKITGTLTSDQIASLAAGKITGQLLDAQLAGISAAKLAGQITGTQITDGAVSTAKLAAAAVEAGNIAAGAIAAEKMAIGDGRNRAYNSDCLILRASGGVSGYSLGWQNTGLVPGLHIAEGGSIYRPKGANAFYVYYSDTPASGTYSDIYLARVNEAGEGQRYPVEPGARYEFSAWVSPHRCTAWLGFEVMDSSGNQLAFYQGNPLTNIILTRDTADPYRVSVLTPPLPAGANSVQLMVRTQFYGDIIPHTFVSQVLFARALPNQTVPSPYAPGLGVIMDGSGLVARSVHADRITASSITASEIAGATITGEKIAAGTIVAGNLAAEAVTTPKIAAGAVVAGSISAGAVVAEKLAIGQGRNLLPNTAFDIVDPNGVPPEFYGWGNTGLPITTHVAPQEWGWNPPGGRSFLVRVGPGFPASATYSDFHWLPRDPAGTVVRTPVEPGQKYELSAWLSTHGCRAFVLLVVFDKAGNVVGAPAGNGIDKVANSDVTVNAQRSNVMWTMPAGAYSAEIRVRTEYDGSSDYAHTFISQLFFARCLPNQTEFSAWAPGETTVIHGNGIMTRTLSADRIVAGSITAGEIAAGAITTPKIAASAVEAGNIAAGAIVASKMAIGDGRNALYNSEARIARADGRPAGWDFWWDSPTPPVIDILKPDDDVWHPPGSASLRLYYNFAPGPSGTISEIYVMRDVQLGESSRCPVQPGKRYEASAWISSHRCIARTYLFVYNRDGDFIIAYEGNALDNYGISYAEASPIRSSVITGPLPSNAYSAAFVVRTHYDGRDYPFTFVSQCLLAQAQDNQTVPSPWAPGLGVVMDGHGIVARTISADRLIASSITSNEIAAGAITAAKIAAGAVVAGTIAANAVTATELAAGAVTTPKIAAGAVTADEIGANAITTAKLSAGAVTTAKVAAGAISANEIAAGAVTAGKVASNAIVAGNIAANAVVAGTVAAGAISTAQIVAGSIVTNSIAIGNITEDLLAQFSATRRTSAYYASFLGTVSMSFTATAGSTILFMARSSNYEIQIRVNSRDSITVGPGVNSNGVIQSMHADYTGTYTMYMTASVGYSDGFMSVVVIQR